MPTETPGSRIPPIPLPVGIPFRIPLRYAFRVALLAIGLLPTWIHASDMDTQVGEEFLHPLPASLNPSREKQADAMAWFARGIFEETDEGPDQALASYQEVLRRQPAFTLLAVQVAREFLQRGLIPEALATLKDTAKARPADFIPPLLIADTYLRHLQKPDLAAEFARTAHSLAPGHFAPVGLLFEIYQYAGQHSRAIRLLSQAARADSNNPHYWIRLAGLHRGLPMDQTTEGRNNRARFDQIMARAGELADSNPEILASIGNLCLDFQDYSSARQYLQSAFALNAEIPGLREQLVQSILQSDDPSPAEPLLWELLEQTPNHVPLLDQLARFALAREDWENLLHLRQRALVADPGQPDRHRDVVVLLLQLQRPESATQFARSARHLFPGHPAFSYLEALSLTALQKGREALPLFQQALAEGLRLGFPDTNAEFYFDYAVAAEQAGEPALTVELLEKSIRLAPSQSARARNFLGFFWADRNENLDQAESLIRHALEDEPNNGAYLDSLGWVHFRKGQFAEALITLLRATELLDRPDPVVFDHVAQTYLALGRSPEALLFWQKSLQLDPGNQIVQKRIEEITLQQARSLPPSFPNPPTTTTPPSSAETSDQIETPAPPLSQIRTHPRLSD